MTVKRNEEPTKERLTKVLRGRAEPGLKRAATKFCEREKRSEAWLVREAVAEFLEKQTA